MVIIIVVIVVIIIIKTPNSPLDHSQDNFPMITWRGEGKHDKHWIEIQTIKVIIIIIFKTAMNMMSCHQADSPRGKAIPASSSLPEHKSPWVSGNKNKDEDADIEILQTIKYDLSDPVRAWFNSSNAGWVAKPKPGEGYQGKCSQQSGSTQIQIHMQILGTYITIITNHKYHQHQNTNISNQVNRLGI